MNLTQRCWLESCRWMRHAQRIPHRAGPSSQGPRWTPGSRESDLSVVFPLFTCGFDPVPDTQALTNGVTAAFHNSLGPYDIIVNLEIKVVTSRRLCAPTMQYHDQHNGDL